ncbi:MAG: hypothetical protein NZ772_17975 [Cyanobacteria bacterium]|nr:hypothetical protein [Cyanobacteriota bacterium]MDW8203158.1 hypothetical protein [Cyanobacteriota bacterium SKYGB_h_bin112]
MNGVLNAIGDWNPQLMRELKGRLKLRNVTIAVIGAIVAQLLLVMAFAGKLPGDPSEDYNRYLLAGASGSEFINWELWWQDMFRAVSWLIPYALPVAGSYALITDLGREARRGTLNFLRLSPQSAREILLGKLLGVPILKYLGVALVVPLHIVAAVQGHIPLVFLLSYYLLVGIATVLCLSVAMLISLLNSSQQQAGAMLMEAGLALAYALLILFMMVPLFMFWNLWTTWQPFSHYLTEATGSHSTGITWFNLPVCDQPIVAHLFVLTNLSAGIYIIWQLLHRCYHNLTGTVMTKAQSYGVNLYTELVILGFLWPTPESPLASWHSDEAIAVTLAVLLTIWQLVKFTVLTAGLSPRRQALLDWSRYRHQMTAQSGLRSLGQDLLWGEKSPAIIAIAVNAGIVAAIWVPMFLSSAIGTTSLVLSLGILLNLCLIVIYATIAQWMLLMKVKKPGLWALGVTVAVAMVPPIMILVLASNSAATGTPDGIWAVLLLSTPLLWVTIQKVSLLSIGLSLVAQMAAIVMLNMTLAKHLHKLGESTTTALLNPA